MTTTAVQAASRPLGYKIAAALAGALVVAAAAQVSIPIAGSPVPFTLQPFAVLVVGGLLGARYGALSLAMYLVMGAAGLPVFAPLGAPGFARLIGPTGGYLISYPLAAAVTGWAVGRSGGRADGLPTARPPVAAAVLAPLAGMVVIYAGGLAQLAVLGLPLAAGYSPFFAADLVKVLAAALILRRLRSTTRALR